MELNIQTAELALREASDSIREHGQIIPGFWPKPVKNIASHCKDLSSEQAYIFRVIA